jgi:hypothetical protein
MTWTVVDDDNDTIQVRAMIHPKTQEDELKGLIAALQKRFYVPSGTIKRITLYDDGRPPEVEIQQ